MKTFIQSSTPFSWSSSPELETLKQAAYLGEQQILQDGTVCKGESGLSLSHERLGHYADPLPPLKEKDLVSLATLFQRDDMDAVEADLNQILLRLLPAPCWEDDPFEFLKEFL